MLKKLKAHKGKLKPFALVAAIFAGISIGAGFLGGMIGFLAGSIPWLGMSWAALIVGGLALLLAEMGWSKYVK